MTMAWQFDHSLQPDNALAERVRRGNGAAFASLVTRHVDAVYTIARNICATFPDALEVVQQTFLACWRELPSAPRAARFTTWLYGIAVKTALAQAQRNRAPCSREPLMLREALECIDHQSRTAFVLRDLVDLPVIEVAAIMEASPEEVCRGAHRARLMLGAVLSQSTGRISSAAR
jgi:RNA polymerase sigma-70 factor (ECF subfamily)